MCSNIRSRPDLLPWITLETLPEFDVSVDLFFCKDVRDYDTAMKIMKLIFSCFPWTGWNLGEDYWDIDDNDVLLNKYCSGKWMAFPEKVNLLLGYSLDDKLRYMMLLPPRGGLRLHPAGTGYTWFDPCWISLASGAKALDDRILSGFEKFLRECAPIVEASYGYIANCGQIGIWRLDYRLAGVFWQTLFGPDYVDMIAPEAFENLPVYRVETMADGSRLVQLTESYEESYSARGEALRRRVMEQIGMEWFTGDYNPNWYPQLRNLVIE